ncbi:hypothetical protein N5P37_000180 [Trichoderma harzianum]|nr:hypothetical protein N5P37_000180 [Trichoderma harzianum]
MEDFHIDAELLSSFNEASEEDLQSLAQLYEDPTNDDQIELYIYLCSLMFRRWHNRQNLQKAIQRAEEWAAATAASHPDHSRRCTILTTVLSWGHQSGATAEDLEVVLDATGLNEETPPTRINLNSEVIRLARSYQQTGRLKHLNKAIDIMELAIRITAKYITPTMLNDFGSILVMRFARTGSLNDLNQAVEIFREVVVTTQPHNHPNRVASLNFLGSCLSVRFDQTGSIDDLNQAIEILREAVDAMPQNHPRLAGHLDYLGTQLGRRFEQTIIIADLDEAIRILREAVDATPRKHPDRAARLRNLGGWLNKRYEQMRPINDPNRPVSIVAKGGIHPSGMLRTTNRGRGNMEYLPNVQSGNVDSMESLISRVPMDDVGLRRYDSDGWEVDSDKSNKEANSGERDCKGKSNQLDALGSETESIYWDENTAERAYAPFSTFDYDLQSRRARPSTIPTSSPGTKGSGPHQAHAMPKAEELEIETQKEVESTNAERLHSSYSLTEEETEEQQPFTDDYDIENTYSINTLLNDPRLRYLQVFAEQLIKDMKQVSDKFCFGNIEAGYLDPVLTEFACKLNSESTNAFQREASNMIHRMRKKIIELLVPRPLDHDTTGNQGGESSLSEDEDQDGFLNRTASIKSRTTVMQWIDDVGTAPHAGEELGPSTEDDPVQDNINHEHGSNEPLLQQAHSLEILSRQPHYEQYIRASDAYQWLITTICQHGLLTFQVPNTMLEIRTKIRTQLRAQESPRRMSSRKPLSAVKMTFCFNWDLDRSMRDAGFSPPYEDALGRMVCLTGSWNEAQATTVRDYMDQTWPRSGHALITLIQTLLSTPEGQECSYQAHEPMPSKHRSDVRATRLTACVQSPSICCISVTGGLYFVSEIGEQIGWLASVLQSSSDHHGPVACTPSVNDLRVRVQDEGSHGLTVVGSCNLSFDLETADISELSPGFCWGRLFCNPVLVRGYPILRRTQPNTGLEMSLVDMAAIIGSQQVVQWGERVIIKGFNMLMIATMAAADIIVWHLLVSEQPEERISYVDPRLDTLYGKATKDISLRILEERRHVIGWCSKVTELCGDATANLNLKSSGLRGPPPSIVIDRLYIGVGTGIVRAGVRMGINQQPKPSYLNREKDYPRLLSWVAVQPIVFYDVADHRGWLTDGASALLHLVQVSLYLDKNNPVYNWVFDATKFKDKWDGLTGNQAALKTLASWDNLNLNLYVAREPCRSGGGWKRDRIHHPRDTSQGDIALY